MLSSNQHEYIEAAHAKAKQPLFTKEKSIAVWLSVLIRNIVTKIDDVSIVFFYKPQSQKKF